jgi:glutaconate CoA-transferase subunit A
MKSRIKSFHDAGALVGDGAKVAIGGVLTAREPVAMVRELIRQKKKDLHTIGGAHSFAVDLMCAAGIVGTVENSFVGFEFDLGLALNYRRACEQGKIKIKETDCNILLQQFRAVEFGLPFMPMPMLGGTDLLKLHPEFKQMRCPYTGEQLTVVPALKPDVALVHAHFADTRGNVKILGPVFKDRLLSTISDTVIVTVERIISDERMRELGPTIPHYYVSAIVEAPYGSHPTSCYPDYSYDRRHMQEYVQFSRQGEADVRNYLDTYVYNTAGHEAYIQSIGGGKKIDLLKSWSGGTGEWMEMFE